MGLREEIAKVRMARSRLEITRAKLQKLDDDQQRLEQMRGKAPSKDSGAAKPHRRTRRQGLDLE
jgi:hypothetical protein